MYGIWEYKALGLWKVYYRVNQITSFMHETYIPILILKCGPKSGLSCRRQVVHPRPQTAQGKSVAKPETPLLIILSIAWKYEVHVIWLCLSDRKQMFHLERHKINLKVLTLCICIIISIGIYVCVTRHMASLCLQNILAWTAHTVPHEELVGEVYF